MLVHLLKHTNVIDVVISSSRLYAMEILSAMGPSPQIIRRTKRGELLSIRISQ